MKRVWCACFAALVVVGAFGGLSIAAGESAVTVINNSDWSIDEFYLSPVQKNQWGPDQLREEVIAPGEKFQLHSIPCGTYDVKLIDEDEDECVVGGVDICADNQRWDIQSDDLLHCQKKTEEAGEEEDDDDE